MSYMKQYTRIERNTGCGYTGTPNTELGQRLRDLRESKGYTQRDVAKLFSMPSIGGRISDWELGHHEPTLNTLRCYAKAFGITLSELLEGVS